MSDTANFDLSWGKRALYGSTNAALFFAGLANLVVGTRAAFNESATIAATSLTAGLVLLFAATIDRFESLKGLGIEAKTRQLDQKIDQADEALKRVREITEISGAALIELKSQMGRLGTVPSVKESTDFVNRIKKIMTHLGSDEATVDAALEPWAQILCFDVALVMVEPLIAPIQARIQQLQQRLESLQPAGGSNPEWIRLSTAIGDASTFITNRLRDIHTLKLDEYPERFMALFDEAPLLHAQTVEPLRESAARFVQGMKSLRQSRILIDVDLWTATIERVRQ